MDQYELIPMKTFKDYRGTLKKVFNKNSLQEALGAEEAYVLYTEKGCIRGNHYHKQNTEYFCVLSGTATVALKSLENEETALLKVDCKDNIIIRVPVNVVHAFRNDWDEQLIILAVALKQYEQDTPDTYSYILLK